MFFLLPQESFLTHALIQAVRVKNKMLEDQNDTIKHLKTNLENKIRESAGHYAALEAKNDDLAHRLADAKHDVQSMERELEGQQSATGARMEQDFGHERAGLRLEIGDLERKLRERNGKCSRPFLMYARLDSILQIEREVRKVKKMFKSKEEDFGVQLSSAIKEKDGLIVRLERDLKVCWPSKCQMVILVCVVRV